MKVTAVFLDGHYDTNQIEYYRRHAKEAEYIIAADGGINFLNALDIVPDLLIGDGDGANFSSARARDVILHSQDKDLTDGDLAIRESLTRRPGNRINIYGGLRRSEEADHFYGNLGLLCKRDVQVSMKNPKHDIYMISDDDTLTIAGEVGDIISLAAYGTEKVESVIGSGLKFEVKSDIPAASSRYLRNSFAEKLVTISVKKGNLLIFHGKKADPLSYPI